LRNKAKAINIRAIDYLDGSALDVVRDQYVQLIPAWANCAILIEQEFFEETEDIYEHKTVKRLLSLIGEDRLEQDKAVWLSHSSEDPKQAKLVTEMRHAIPEEVNRRLKFEKMGTDLAVPFEHVRAFLEFSISTCQEHNVPYVIWGHIPQLHINLVPKTEKEYVRAKKVYSILVQRAVDLTGTPAAEHGIGKNKHEYLRLMVGDEGIEGMRRIKLALDPKDILGRGNILGSAEKLIGEIERLSQPRDDEWEDQEGHLQRLINYSNAVWELLAAGIDILPAHYVNTVILNKEDYLPSACILIEVEDYFADPLDYRSGFDVLDFDRYGDLLSQITTSRKTYLLKGFRDSVTKDLDEFFEKLDNFLEPGDRILILDAFDAFHAKELILQRGYKEITDWLSSELQSRLEEVFQRVYKTERLMKLEGKTAFYVPTSIVILEKPKTNTSPSVPDDSTDSSGTQNGVLGWPIQMDIGLLESVGILVIGLLAIWVINQFTNPHCNFGYFREFDLVALQKLFPDLPEEDMGLFCQGQRTLNVFGLPLRVSDDGKTLLVDFKGYKEGSTELTFNGLLGMDCGLFGEIGILPTVLSFAMVVGMLMTKEQRIQAVRNNGFDRDQDEAEIIADEIEKSVRRIYAYWLGVGMKKKDREQQIRFKADQFASNAHPILLTRWQRSSPLRHYVDMLFDILVAISGLYLIFFVLVLKKEICTACSEGILVLITVFLAMGAINAISYLYRIWDYRRTKARIDYGESYDKISIKPTDDEANLRKSVAHEIFHSFCSDQSLLMDAFAELRVIQERLMGQDSDIIKMVHDQRHPIDTLEKRLEEKAHFDHRYSLPWGVEPRWTYRFAEDLGQAIYESTGRRIGASYRVLFAMEDGLSLAEALEKYNIKVGNEKERHPSSGGSMNVLTAPLGLDSALLQYPSTFAQAGILLMILGFAAVAMIKSKKGDNKNENKIGEDELHYPALTSSEVAAVNRPNYVSPLDFRQAYQDARRRILNEQKRKRKKNQNEKSENESTQNMVVTPPGLESGLSAEAGILLFILSAFVFAMAKQNRRQKRFKNRKKNKSPPKKTNKLLRFFKEHIPLRVYLYAAFVTILFLFAKLFFLRSPPHTDEIRKIMTERIMAMGYPESVAQDYIEYSADWDIEEMRELYHYFVLGMSMQERNQKDIHIIKAAILFHLETHIENSSLSDSIWYSDELDDMMKGAYPHCLGVPIVSDPVLWACGFHVQGIETIRVPNIDSTGTSLHIGQLIRLSSGQYVILDMGGGLSGELIYKTEDLSDGLNLDRNISEPFEFEKMYQPDGYYFVAIDSTFINRVYWRIRLLNSRQMEGMRYYQQAIYFPSGEKIPFLIKAHEIDSLATAPLLDLSTNKFAMTRDVVAIEGDSLLYQDARELLNEVIRIDPHYAGAYLERSLLHYEIGDSLSAEDDFQKLLSLLNGYERIYLRRYLFQGSGYFHYLNIRSALYCFQKAIEIDPNSAQAYYGLACVQYPFTDLREEAKRNLDRALALDPSLKTLVDNLIQSMDSTSNLNYQDWIHSPRTNLHELTAPFGFGEMDLVAGLVLALAVLAMVRANQQQSFDIIPSKRFMQDWDTLPAVLKPVVAAKIWI
ncbi:MAG: FAD-linked oxidase C-terminal domain-containing protein, partial [Candidatus Omnitrophota bacterium]